MALKKKIVMYSCLEIRPIVFIGIFLSSIVLILYSYTQNKTIHLDLQIRIHHSLVVVTLLAPFDHVGFTY